MSLLSGTDFHLNIDKNASFQIGHEHRLCVALAKSPCLSDHTLLIFLESVGVTIGANGHLLRHDRVAASADLILSRVTNDFVSPAGTFMKGFAFVCHVDEKIRSVEKNSRDKNERFFLLRVKFAIRLCALSLSCSQSGV